MKYKKPEMPLNEVRAVLGKTENDMRRTFSLSAFKKITARHEHPADMHRQEKFITSEARALIDKAEAENRDITPTEQNAYDGALAWIEFHNYDLYLKASNDANNANNATNSRIFAKDQKCSAQGGENNYHGLNLGSIMKAMAIGSSGNEGLQNALSIGTDSAGGYTAPVEILREFIDKLRSKSVLMAAGAQTVLLEAKKTNIATVVTDPTAGWRAENSSVSESDLVLGNVQFSPQSLAVLVKVSRELLEDSLNIEEILLNSLAQGIATQLDYAGLYGTGLTNQPTGLQKQLTTASYFTDLGTNGAKLSASAYYKPLLKSMATIAGNNDQANAFVMSPRTRHDIMAFADTTNQPLRPPELISKNIQILDTSSVPNNITYGTGVNTSEIFIGNFKNLMLGMREQLRIEVLNQTFAGNLQIGFLAHLRADWQVQRLPSFTMLKGIVAE